MGLAWLLPAAWWLGALVAVPVAVHLLARQRRRPLRFPTLRFIEAASAPSRRHWRVRDPGLLAIRSATLLAIAAAIAGPMVVTASRQARWAARVARAMVVAPEVVAGPAVAAAEVREADGIGRRFVTSDVAAGLADASAWLQAQAPSRREIVVVGPLPRGALSAADVRALPVGLGLTFVRSGTLAAPVRAHTAARLVGDTLWRVTDAVTYDDASTAVHETGRTLAPGRAVEVTAPMEERPAAEAARRAVLRLGVRLASPLAASITVPWTGNVGAMAADVDAATTTKDDRLSHEPLAIADETLAEWSRAASLFGAAAPVDEGDRRAVWLVALALLALEWWWRRRPA